MKRKLITFLLILSISITMFSTDEFMTVSAMNCENTNVAIILASGHDYEESVWIQNYMGSWGSEFSIVGLTEEITAPGSPTIQADMLTSEIDNITDYDAIFIPGGNLAEALIADTNTLNLLNEANDGGVVIAGICAGTQVMSAAGLVDGKNFTTYASHIDELIAAGGTYVGGKVATDGNIITAAPPNYLEVSYHIAFALGRNYAFETSHELIGSDITITLDVAEERIFTNITIEIFSVEKDGSRSLGYTGLAEYVEDDGIYKFTLNNLESGDYEVDVTFNSFFENNFSKMTFSNEMDFNIDSPQGLKSMDVVILVVGFVGIILAIKGLKRRDN